MGQLLGLNSRLFLQDLGQGEGQSDPAKGLLHAEIQRIGGPIPGGAQWRLAEAVPSPAERGQPLYHSHEALETGVFSWRLRH